MIKKVTESMLWRHIIEDFSCDYQMIDYVNHSYEDQLNKFCNNIIPIDVCKKIYNSLCDFNDGDEPLHENFYKFVDELQKEQVGFYE